LTKFHKVSIYLVVEGKIETHGSIVDMRDYYLANKWISLPKALKITKQIGVLKEISKIIAVTTHMPIAEKRLSDYVKRNGFSMIPSFDLFIMEQPLILNDDSTIVSVRRNYKAHKTVLYDFVHKSFFNAKRYLPRGNKS